MALAEGLEKGGNTSWTKVRLKGGVHTERSHGTMEESRDVADALQWSNGQKLDMLLDWVSDLMNGYHI